MNKINPIMAMKTCEVSSDNLSETRNFGNGWGLFVEIDIIDIKYITKYKRANNTLQTIMEEDDIEKNLEEIYTKNLDSPRQQNESCKKIGRFSSLCFISIMTYLIIYLI